MFGVQDLSRVCRGLNPVSSCGISTSTGTAGVLSPDVCLDSMSLKGSADTSSSNGRIMIIDGTSILYRSYFKLLGMSGFEFHQSEVLFDILGNSFSIFTCIVNEVRDQH